MPAGKRVLVSFTPEQWGMVRAYVGRAGINEADTVRNIVVYWLLSRGERDQVPDTPRLAERGSGRK